MAAHLFFAHATHATDKFPKDVQSFIAKRDGCEHFRSEVPDPPEKKRIEEINRDIKRLCTCTDSKLAALKRKYAASANIMARLDSYESRIEARPPAC